MMTPDSKLALMMIATSFLGVWTGWSFSALVDDVKIKSSRGFRRFRLAVMSLLVLLFFGALARRTPQAALLFLACGTTAFFYFRGRVRPR